MSYFELEVMLFTILILACNTGSWIFLYFNVSDQLLGFGWMICEAIPAFQ